MPITGGGVYRGGPDPSLRPSAWKCPSCHAPNAGPLEAGCVACGAGTAKQAEVAAAQRDAMVVSDQVLTPLLVGEADAHVALLQAPLTQRARLTLARALAYYGDSGTPSVDELTRAQCLAWARKMAAAVDTERDAETLGTGDEPTHAQ